MHVASSMQIQAIKSLIDTRQIYQAARCEEHGTLLNALLPQPIDCTQKEGMPFNRNHTGVLLQYPREKSLDIDSLYKGYTSALRLRIANAVEKTNFYLCRINESNRNVPSFFPLSNELALKKFTHGVLNNNDIIAAIDIARLDKRSKRYIKN